MQSFNSLIWNCIALSQSEHNVYYSCFSTPIQSSGYALYGITHCTTNVCACVLAYMCWTNVKRYLSPLLHFHFCHCCFETNAQQYISRPCLCKNYVMHNRNNTHTHTIVISISLGWNERCLSYRTSQPSFTPCNGSEYFGHFCRSHFIQILTYGFRSSIRRMVIESFFFCFFLFFSFQFFG